MAFSCEPAEYDIRPQFAASPPPPPGVGVNLGFFTDIYECFNEWGEGGPGAGTCGVQGGTCIGLHACVDPNTSEEPKNMKEIPKST